MKYDMDHLDLKSAFPAEPEACHEALMNAARSVREEKSKVKRFSVRTALIAALIIVATVAVAVAAGQYFGWSDYMRDHFGVNVPEDAVTAMQQDDSMSWEVGPLIFTVKELISDGRCAHASVEIRTTDGSQALLTDYAYDAVGAAGEEMKAWAQKMGLSSASINWVQAAKELNLPLYEVRAILEEDPEVSGGESMEDLMRNEDGSITYFSMPLLDYEKAKDGFTANFYLRAAEIDPEGGEEKSPDKMRTDSFKVEVQPMIEEAVYLPEGNEIVLMGEENENVAFTVLRVEMERYVTGVYATVVCTIQDGVYKDADEWLEEGGEIPGRLSTEDGTDIPDGMSLSWRDNMDNWPEISEEMSLSLESLPDVVVLNDQVKLRKQ